MTTPAPTTPRKKSLLKKILIALVTILVVLIVVIAMQPAEYRVTRTGSMKAPAAVVFAQVNDMHLWQAWSPWAKIDPAAKYTYEGPAAGTGAGFRWVGNSEVGEGRMTITESRANEFIRFHLEFFKPMAGISAAEFTFKSEGNQTSVTWTMTGKKNFISKAFCLFLSMDKMVGGQFESGLASMKSIVEALPKP